MADFELNQADHYCSEIEVVVSQWYENAKDETNNIFYTPKNDTV